MLAHKASHEGTRRRRGDRRAQGGVRAAGDPRRGLHRSRDRLGGLTETEAEKQGLKVEVAKFPWAASGRATTLDRTDGLTKLIIDPETERILGVGIVGAGAGELIAEGVLAIEMGAIAVRPQADHPPAPDAVRDGDGGGRGLLRPGHARLQAEEEVGHVVGRDFSSARVTASACSCAWYELRTSGPASTCTKPRSSAMRFSSAELVGVVVAHHHGVRRATGAGTGRA